VGVFTRHESAARELQVSSVTIHVDSGRQHHPVGGGGWSHTAGGPAPIHRGTGPDPPVDRPRSTGRRPDPPGTGPIHRSTGPDPPGNRRRSTGVTAPIYRGTSSETSFHLSYTLCISTDDPYGPASPSHCRVPHDAHEAARRAGPSTGPRPNIVKRKLTDNEPFAGPRHSNRYV